MNSRLRKKSAPLAAIGAVALATAGLWAIQVGSGRPANTAGATGAAASVAHAPQVTATPTPRPAAAKAASAEAAAATSSAAGGRRKSDAPLTGTFTLWGSTPLADPCVHRTAAPDIHAGAQVSVHAVNGAVVATTVLSSGRSEGTHRGCVYRFTFTPLPLDPSFSVTVGSRSGPLYSAALVAAASDHITLNLGLPQ